MNALGNNPPPPTLGGNGFWNGGQQTGNPGSAAGNPPSTNDPAFQAWWQNQQMNGPNGYPINSFMPQNANPWNNPQSDPRLRTY